MTRARLRTALVVDDEEHRRAEMCAGLLEHGVACDEAATLANAIRLLASSAYDLVVCDMVLCDPPGEANPALRGYLAACFALTRQPAGVVVQASSWRRWAHPGSVLVGWRVCEVADLVYGCPVNAGPVTDGGCPWRALQHVAAATPAQRPDAVEALMRLPIVRELEDLSGLGVSLEALGDAAAGLGAWDAALSAVHQALFPGAPGATHAG